MRNRLPLRMWTLTFPTLPQNSKMRILRYFLRFYVFNDHPLLIHYLFLRWVVSMPKVEVLLTLLSYVFLFVKCGVEMFTLLLLLVLTGFGQPGQGTC